MTASRKSMATAYAFGFNWLYFSAGYFAYGKCHTVSPGDHLQIS